ncbi:Y+L amino acid transporter 2 [Anopheles ziemanni]|uniref:Y+L amino acid transporter 2 n=1 Tax=Anopheles coustani TaxID=139045 RepID=UPI002658BEEC|nr:Y+L amino acid transporter 2 [Anopheles coustani]XP_058174466.1 Y+L amino acid transporter 2 [Anopheles ziemanni]
MAKVGDVEIRPAQQGFRRESDEGKAVEGTSADGGDSSSGGIKMKKELGLMDGVAIIVGVIVGAGIFVSPKGVLLYSGSIGQAIIVWILSGVLSMVGALCYAELGTMIPKSGGDYAYIGEAFGPLPAFLYLWVALLILVPAGNAITAITFAQYLLQPLWPTCEPPYESVRLLAAIITCLLTAINCRNVKWVTRVTETFTGMKVLALLVITGAGAWHLMSGNTELLETPFANSKLQPGFIAVAFYNGLFSYSGWNYLNFVTEELKDPYRNLPRAICISMPVVTIIYVVTNIAYFAVLPPDEMLSSQAVAVTFAEKMLSFMAWTMPLFVACSTFGSLNGAIFASSRLFFVGARNGHLPAALSLININCLTPIPSLLFLCALTLILLFIRDVFAIINYVSYVEILFIFISVAGLLRLRQTAPDQHRPIKVSLVAPIVFLLTAGFLVIFSVFESPMEVGIGTLVILLGIPVYYITIGKPWSWLTQKSQAFNTFCCKLFLCMPNSEKID